MFGCKVTDGGLDTGSSSGLLIFSHPEDLIGHLFASPFAFDFLDLLGAEDQHAVFEAPDLT